MNKQKKKISKIIIIALTLVFIFPTYSKMESQISNNTVQIDETEISNQEEMFGISSFIQNSKQYTGNFFDDIDIGEILNSAIKGEIDNTTIYKKILNKLGNEVQTGIKSLACILAIIIIHSILKSISESLENDSVSKLSVLLQPHRSVYSQLHR